MISYIRSFPNSAHAPMSLSPADLSRLASPIRTSVSSIGYRLAYEAPLVIESWSSLTHGTARFEAMC